MNEPLRPPSDPEALLAHLTEALQQGESIAPQALEALARWRLGCGDGRGAARWQRWSRQPPASAELRSALRELLLRLNRHALAERLGEAEGWPAVLQALAQRNTDQALTLQRQLIAAAARHSITWVWVRGHNGHPENERVDKLASDAALGAAIP